MRVAFVCWPANAHLYPLVPMAWALKAAGHEVCVVSHPSLAATTASMGLTPVSFYGDDTPAVGPGRAWTAERADLARITAELDLAADDPDLEHWSVFTQFYLPSTWDFLPYRADPAEPMPAMDGLVRFAREWKPDLVLWDPCMPGAAVAARAAGAAQARWWTAPDVFCKSMDTFAEVTGRPGAPVIDNPLVETVRPLAERYGVEVDRELLFGQWTINSQPQAIGPEVSARTLPLRWIPHSSQTSVPDWLYPVPERPRVAMSLGLSERQFMKGGWYHIPALLEALAGLDVEVVATLNEAQLADVKAIPDNVRVTDFFPLDQLLPTCSLAIHHGGMGTTMPVVANGVPHVLVDFAHHEFSADPAGARNGRSRYTLGPALSRFIEASGAGLVVDVGTPSVDQIRKSIDAVLTDPAYRAGATRLRSELLSTPSPAEFVPILERLVAAR